MHEKCCTICHNNHITRHEETMVCTTCLMGMTRAQRMEVAQDMRKQGLSLQTVSERLGINVTTLCQQTSHVPKHVREKQAQKKQVRTCAPVPRKANAEYQFKPRSIDLDSIARRI